jgi:hypothetical protein
MDEIKEFEHSISLTKRQVRLMAAVCLAVCIGIATGERYILLRFPKPCGGITPLLSGMPQFAMLALIVALAAYLRAIRNNAVELRDNIRQGRVKQYPLHPTCFDFSRKKMVLLDEMANKMSIAGPYFIWLMVIVGGRITYEAFLKLFGIDSQCNCWLYIVDTIVALWMLLGLVGLAIAHFSARKTDEAIRIAARREEGEALTFSGDGVLKEP